MIGTQEHYAEGYAVGLLGWHIEDDWGGYPLQIRGRMEGWVCDVVPDQFLLGSVTPWAS
jgi:hypothetical protein